MTEMVLYGSTRAPGKHGSAVRPGATLPEKNGEALKPDEGDRWVNEAIAAESRLRIAHHIGTRDTEDWTALMGKVKAVLDPNAPLPLFASDEWDPCQRGLEATFGTMQPVPYQGVGRPPNPRLVMPADFMYVQVVKHRENDRVVKVDRRVVYGNPERVQSVLEETGTTINTAFIERSNLTTRTWNNRFVRKGLGFSKDDDFLAWSLELTRVRDNFLRYHPSLRDVDEERTVREGRPRYRHRSPAMASGITDHKWSWKEVLYWRKPT